MLCQRKFDGVELRPLNKLTLLYLSFWILKNKKKCIFFYPRKDAWMTLFASNSNVNVFCFEVKSFSTLFVLLFVFVYCLPKWNANKCDC